MTTDIRVQAGDFDAGKVIDSIRQGRTDIGAIACFVGLVRDLPDKRLLHMTLEHYPAMTEQALREIAEHANERWHLQHVSVIHRYGELKPSDQIVLVSVAAEHRRAAFESCEFIMDYLKTGAPFWKKETTEYGSHWVEARATDTESRRRWEKD